MISTCLCAGISCDEKMKKILNAILAVGMAVALAACGGGSPTTSPAAPAEGGAAAEGGGADGKIAIITNTVSQNEEEYRSAETLLEQYGADKIIHQTWPDNFMAEQEQLVSIVGKIAADPEVKALVINQAVPGTNAAVDKLLETRDDMFIVYCTPQENPVDVVERANLTLIADKLAMGTAMVEQAAEMGAKTFVHYSFPRHMSQVLLSGARERIKDKCAELGLEYVDATAPDPTGDTGLPGAQQFILEDVPKMVAQYGPDTAFYSTNCAMQVPLIKKVVDEKAIYPQPCDPSPYHGFPTALGIETGDTMGDIDYVVAETNRIVRENGVEGRLATWPVPDSMMSTNIGVEYAMKWMNGEVPQEGVDMAVLKQLAKDYAGVDVQFNPYVEDGVEYPTFLNSIMDYLVYNG